MVVLPLDTWHHGKVVLFRGVFDQKFIRVIDQLVVGNRVILEWFWDGHLGIEKVKEFRPCRKSVFLAVL